MVSSQPNTYPGGREGFVGLGETRTKNLDSAAYNARCALAPPINFDHVSLDFFSAGKDQSARSFHEV